MSSCRVSTFASLTSFSLVVYTYPPIHSFCDGILMLFAYHCEVIHSKHTRIKGDGRGSKAISMCQHRIHSSLQGHWSNRVEQQDGKHPIEDYGQKCVVGKNSALPVYHRRQPQRTRWSKFFTVRVVVESKMHKLLGQNVRWVGFSWLFYLSKSWQSIMSRFHIRFVRVWAIRPENRETGPRGSEKNWAFISVWVPTRGTKKKDLRKMVGRLGGLSQMTAFFPHSWWQAE